MGLRLSAGTGYRCSSHLLKSSGDLSAAKPSPWKNLFLPRTANYLWAFHQMMAISLVVLLMKWI